MIVPLYTFYSFSVKRYISPESLTRVFPFFYRLFRLVSDNPKVGRLFPFGKKKFPYKKLLNENEVISHGERFMTTLGQVVGGLDDPEFLVPMLHQLATRHSGYGVTKEFFLVS